MKLKWECLAFCLIAVFTVCGLFFWNKVLRKPMLDSKLCDLASTVSSVPDDWRIFHNKELGYTLFYPPEWSRTKLNGIGYAMDFDDPDENTMMSSFSILQETRPWEQIKKVYAEEWSREFPGLTTTEIAIGGLSGTRYDYPQGENSDIFLLRGDDVIEITVNRRASEDIQTILRNIRFDLKN